MTPLPEPWQVYDSTAQSYDQWFDSTGRKIFAIELAAFRRILTSLRRPFLEVGVGTGRFAVELDVGIGADPSLEMIRRARMRELQVMKAKGEALPFQSNVFGSVFVIATLWVVDRPKLLLREVHRVLREDGKVLIGFVPRESEWGRFYERKGTENGESYWVQKLLTTPDVISLLDSQGFRLNGAVSTLLQPPGKVEGFEDPIDGFNPRAGFVVISASRGGDG